MTNNGGEHSRRKEKVGEYKRKRKDDADDDGCFFCKDGGRLMFCDEEECLKAYHPSCVNKDDSFVNSGVHWTCDVHSCFVCHKSPNLSCLTCPKSLCKRCIGSTKFVQIKGEKGFCSSCLSLALQVEGNRDAVFDMPYESRFSGVWMVLSEKEDITLEDLSSAYDRMKKNICYIPNSDVDAEHVTICKGKTPMVKRKKFSLQNKIPSAVAAEREPEVARVKQEAEMEGTGIYLGDRGIASRDASARHFEIGSAINFRTENGKNHSSNAKVIEGDRGIAGRDASAQHSEIASTNNVGTGNGKNHSATAKVNEGDRGVVVRVASTPNCLIGSVINDRTGNGNNHSATAKVFEGDEGAMGQNDSSQRITIGSADNNGTRKGDRGIVGRDASSRHSKNVSSNNKEIGKGKNHSVTAKVIEGGQGIMVQDASQCLQIGSNNDGTGEGNDYNVDAKNVTEGDQVLDPNAFTEMTKRAKINKAGVVNDDATELENPVSSIANFTEGNKEAENTGPTFDKQAEAILKTRSERYNSSTEVLDQPNFAIKDQEFEWNVIVSEDGSVKGPYPLHSLKCLQDIYAVSSFLKVLKKGESKETAIPLGDALKLHSI